MVLCRARLYDGAGFLLTPQFNRGCPICRLWEVVLKRRTYGGIVDAGWHRPYLEKITFSSATNPIAQAPFSSNTPLAKLKIPL